MTGRPDDLHAGPNFEIEVGAMDYGLGIDFLLHTRAVVDLARLEVRPAP